MPCWWKSVLIGQGWRKPSSNHLWCNNLNPITEHVWPWTTRNRKTAEQGPPLSWMSLMSEKWKYDAKEKHSTLYATLCKPHCISVSGSRDRGTFLRVVHLKKKKKRSYFLWPSTFLINFELVKNATLIPFHCFQLSNWLIPICAQPTRTADHHLLYPLK